MNRTGILVDTYAWVEILKNTDWGQRALTLVERNPPVFISVLTLYELRYLLEEQYSFDQVQSLFGTILSHSEVIPVEKQIAIIGGSIKLEQKRRKNKMGAMDCLILATAKFYNLKVLTGDPHFSECEEIIAI